LVRRGGHEPVTRYIARETFGADGITLKHLWQRQAVPRTLPSIRLRLLRLVVPVGRGQTQIPASRADHRQRCRRRDPWARRGRELWRCSLQLLSSRSWQAAASDLERLVEIRPSGQSGRAGRHW
jgi:hypothetical protein